MYSLINNPEAPPPQSVELKTSFTAPFRTVAAAEVCDTESTGVFKRSVFVHCPEKSLFVFYYRPMGARGFTDIAASVHQLRVKPIQRSPSLFTVRRSGPPGSGKSIDQTNQCIDRAGENTAVLPRTSKRFVRAKASHLGNTKMYLLKSEDCCE